MESSGKTKFYGRTGGFLAVKNKSDELFKILNKAALLMKGADGCIEYIVGRDINDKNAIWVFEVWESAKLHKESLKNEAVKELISQAIPMIKDQIPSGAELEIVNENMEGD